MTVKKPLNINDEEVRDGMSGIEHPLSQPTTMSYPLHRIRMAEIARRFVDRNPLMTAQASGPSYDSIMDTDTELQSSLNQIPPFFSMSQASLVETYQLSPMRAGAIVHQGYILRSLLYAQRCKLHLPYSSSGYTDPAYACSRDTCLESARMIVRLEMDIKASGLGRTIHYSFVSLVVGIFMATIVLLVDHCHRKSTHRHAMPLQGELADAMRILEEARHESETTAKFLDSLLLILRKHKVTPPCRDEPQPVSTRTRMEESSTAASGVGSDNATASHDPHTSSNTMPIPLTAPSSVLGSTECGSDDIFGDGLVNGDDMSSYFNDLAQTFEQGIDIANFDWSDIFAGAESSFA